MCWVLTRNGRSTFYEYGLITESQTQATLRNAITQIIGKGKGKGKGKVHPRTGHEGPQGEQRYSSTLSLTSALDGVGANATPRPLYPRERDPLPILQEAGQVPGPVWTGAENLAPTGVRSPDRPARSESQFRRRYPGPFTEYWICCKFSEIALERVSNKLVCRMQTRFNWCIMSRSCEQSFCIP